MVTVVLVLQIHAHDVNEHPGKEPLGEREQALEIMKRNACQEKHRIAFIAQRSNITIQTDISIMIHKFKNQKKEIPWQRSAQRTRSTRLFFSQSGKPSQIIIIALPFFTYFPLSFYLLLPPNQLDRVLLASDALFSTVLSSLSTLVPSFLAVS